MSNGVFVSLAKTECVYLASEQIRQLCLFADAGCPALVAVVVPPPALAAQSDAELERFYLALFRSMATSQRLRACEVPAAVLIDRDEWTPNNGLLSPLFKLVRRKIQARHAAALLRRFAELTLTPPPPPIEIASDSGSEAMPAPDRALAIAEQVLGRKLDSTQSFVANGGDSLTAASFLLRLRSAFPSASIAFDFATSAPLATVAAHARGDSHQQSRWMTTNDVELRAQIDRDVQPPPAPVERITRTLEPHGAILLTGATGFLGAHLLAALLAKSADAAVYCIVRAPSDREAQQRLSDALVRFRVPLSALPATVRAVAGDLTRADLGVTAGMRRELCERVSTVLHAAADVKFGASYAALRLANVVATAHLLTLCASCEPPMRLHHVSSLSVFGALGESAAQSETAEIPKSAAEVTARCTDGYSQSKCASETLLERAATAGAHRVPVTIHRYAPPLNLKFNLTHLGHFCDCSAKLLLTLPLVAASFRGTRPPASLIRSTGSPYSSAPFYTAMRSPLRRAPCRSPLWTLSPRPSVRS